MSVRYQRLSPRTTVAHAKKQDWRAIKQWGWAFPELLPNTKRTREAEEVHLCLLWISAVVPAARQVCFSTYASGLTSSNKVKEAGEKRPRTVKGSVLGYHLHSNRQRQDRLQPRGRGH